MRHLKKILIQKTILSFSVLVTLASPSWAKTVHLEWKAIPAASKYEMVLQRDGKSIYKKIISEPQWKGNIAPGLLTYQIRAIDKMERPGRWSEAHALLVSPENPPLLLLPEAGKELSYYSAENKVLLKWQPVAGATRYQLEIRCSNSAFSPQKLTLPQTEFELLSPPSGKYQWTVTPVFEASPLFPEKLRGKTWLASQNAESEFEIEILKLQAPDLIEPKGVQPPPKTGRLKFAWKPVEGAKAYAVEIIYKPTQKSVAQFHTQKTAVLVPFAREGEYEWKVQSLASPPQGRDLASVASSGRSESSALDFKVDRSALHVEGFGYIALSTMLAPYTYKIISPTTGAAGSTQSYAMTGRISGEYWPGGSAIGASFGVDDTVFALNGTTYTRMQFEAHAKYRLALSKDRFGWFLSPKLGFEYRQYPHLTPIVSSHTGRVTGIASAPLWSLGPSLGIDIRKQWSESWSLGIKTAYFVPLTLSGASSGSSLGGSANARNLALGAQALYWLNKRWGFGAGAFYELRSISYQPGSSSSSSTQNSALRFSAASSSGSVSTSPHEEVYMDAVYFFGSIIFSFGR